MAELVWKPLLPTGTHQAPARDPRTGKVATRPVVVPPQRVQHFLNSFKKLKAQGVNFPVPWGHKLLALPDERIDSAEEWRKAVEAQNEANVLGNAGFIEDMRVAPDGTLEFAMLPPPGWEVCHSTGDLINPATGTRVREVSAGIGNWTDGKGVTHRDIIVHAALCTLPVVAGLGGFRPEPGQTQLSAGTVEFTCFLSTRTGGPRMADKPDDDKVDDTVANPAPDDDGDEDDLYEPEPAPQDEPEPVVPSGKTKDHCEQAIQLLAEAGLPLPADTDEKNFCERLVTALSVVASLGGRFELADQNEPNETTPPPAAGSTEAPPAPEAPPVMMSTTAIKDPVARTMAINAEKRTQKDLEKGWHALKKLGVPAHICDREAQEASQVQLSINSRTGKIKRPEAQGRLRLVTEIFKALAGAAPDRTDLSTAVPSPTDAAGSRPARGQQEPGKTADGENHADWLTRQTQSLLGPNAKPKLFS